VAEGDLDEGPGHYPGTPLPGQAGNSGIAGHRTTYGAPFFQLNELTAGDRIYLTDTTGTTWVYRVVRQWVVSPDDVAVLAPTRTAVLTLTTCNPRFSAISRLVVRADLVTYLSPGTVTVVVPGPAAQPSRAQPTPASGPTGTAPPSTTPSSASSSKGADQIADTPVISGQAGTAGTGTAAAEWGVLALVLWVAVRLGAARRRGWHQALLVTAGAAISLGPLWFTFENVAHLLPANI